MTTAILTDKQSEEKSATTGRKFACSTWAFSKKLVSVLSCFLVLLLSNVSAFAQQSQTISFPTQPNPYVTALPATMEVSATATSTTLPVVFSSLTPSICTVSNPTSTQLGDTSQQIWLSTITLESPGTCTIAANQTGNSSYLAAPQVTQSFTYVAPQTINFAALPNQTYGVAPFTLAATASSGLPVSFVSTQPLVCTVSGSTVTIIGVGSCSVIAEQVGNSSYAAQQLEQSFTVAMASQTISFAALPNQLMGAAPFAISATASSALPVTFKSGTTSVCTVSGNAVTLVADGTCTINAAQAGNVNYAAATAVAQSFDVGSGAQTISFAAVSTQTVSTTPIVLTATASSGLVVTFTPANTAICQVLGSKLYPVSGGTCTITASQAGNTTYLSAPPVTQSFTILPSSQTISFGGPSSPYVAALQTTQQITAQTTSNLQAVFTSLTPSVCTLSDPTSTSFPGLPTQIWLTTITLLSPGTCTITADQSGNGAYLAAPEVTQSFVYQATQTINFAAWPNLTYGVAPFTVTATATASSGLPVSFVPSTPSVCSVNGSTVTILSGGICGVVAEQAGNSNYTAAPQVQQSFTVATASQAISFAALPNQLMGAAPFAISATASSALPVTFKSGTTSVCTVSGNTITLVADGTCTINATQAGNVSYAAATAVAQSFDIASGAQAISFAAIPTQTVSTTPIALTATANSGLVVTFTSANTAICQVLGSKLYLVSGGTCTITANQAGNGSTALPAVPITQSFTILPSSQTIGFALPISSPYVAASQSTITIQASTTSNLQVVFTSLTPSVCAVSNPTDEGIGSGASYEVVSLATITFLSPGTCTLAADQSGSGAYLAAPEVTQSLVYQATQTINFAAWPNLTYGVAPFTVTATATASSGLPVSFVPSTPSVCSVNGSTITILSGGICGVVAEQAGNSNYTAAPQVQQSFTVATASQAISFAALPNQLMGAAPFAISATASSALPVTFKSGTTSVCTVSGNTVTLVADGTCTINATQAGNVNYAAATAVVQSFDVSTTTQTISFASIPTQTVSATPIALTATANSGLAVTFTSANTAICQVLGSKLYLVSGGTCAITANQVGNTTYLPASPVTQSFTILPSSQTIGFALQISSPYAAASQSTITAQATTTSNLQAVFASLTPSVCTLSNPTSTSFPGLPTQIWLTTVTLLSPGTCTITADQSGNGAYLVAPEVTQSFVYQATQTINFPALSNQTYLTYGATPLTVTVAATASSGLPVNFVSAQPSVCTVNGSTVTIISGGTCSVVAEQAGNSSYATAPQVQQSFTVATQTEAQTISFAPIPNQMVGPYPYYVSSPFAVSATASSGLPVIFKSSTTSVCTLSGATGATVTMVTPGTCTITATQAGNAIYSPATAVAQSFQIATNTQTVNFPVISNQTYGVGTFTVSATASSGLPVTFTSSTSTVCLISAAGKVYIVGAGTCTLTASEVGDSGGASAVTYLPAPPATQSFTILPSSQTISFAGPSSPYVAALQSTTQIDAGASSITLQVVFSSLTPTVCAVSNPTSTSFPGLPQLTWWSTITFLSPGTCTIAADQSGNSNYLPAPEVIQSFTYLASQTINFPSLGTVDYGTPLTVEAIASSGLPVTYTSGTTSVCTVSGSNVTLLQAGTCSINANQAGNDYYSVAPQVGISFAVGWGNQTINFAPIPNQIYSATSLAISATASSGLPVIFTSSTTSVCTVSGSTVTMLTPGTCAITANQGGVTYQYMAASPVVQSFTVSDSSETITFAALPNKLIGTAPFAISASTSSGLPITFTTATPAVCMVSGSTITLVTPGTCTINANQAGNIDYSAAAQVAQSFVVIATQMIDFPSLPSPYTGNLQTIVTLNATASSSLPVIFTSATPAICTVSGTTVTVIGVGTCTIDANQSGNSSYATAPQVAQSFIVSALSQNISFASLNNVTYGVAPLTVSATANSGLPVTFSSTTPTVCTVSGSMVTVIAGGSCTIAANQAGNTTYAAAPQVTQSFTVLGQSQTISFAALNAQTYGAASFPVSATASSSLPVVFSSTTPAVCTVTGSTVTIVGGGTCSVNADQPGNADISAATTVTQAFTVVAAAQTINFGSLVNQTYGAAPITLSATASSGLPVVFNTVTQAVCTISGSTLTLVGAGTCLVNADQPGNNNYSAAAMVTQGFTVSAAAQTITFGTLANQTYGVAPITLSATTSSGLPVVYSSITQSICTVSGNTVTVLSGGLCSINADQPGNGSYAAASTITQAFVVADASQTISFPAIAAQNMGEAPFALNATSSVNLPITYTTSTPAVCSVSGQMVILNAVGSCVVTASQAGNNDYTTATAVTQSFNVVPMTAQSSTALAVSENPIQMLDRDTLTATVTGNNPTGTVIFMDGTGVLGTAALTSGQAVLTPSFDGAGAQSITAVYSGDANNPGSTSASLALNVLYSWVILTSPTNGDTYNGPANVFMRVQALGTIGTVNASFWVNGKTYTATPDSTGGYYATVNMPVSATPYEVFATVTDDSGTQSRETGIANVNVVASGAELTINTPTVSGSTINMSAVATPVAGATVQFFAIQQSTTSDTFVQPITGPGTGNAATNNNGTWSYAWANVPNGVYTISAELVSSTGTVLGQQTAPGAITIGGPASGTTLSASATSVTTGKSLTLTAIVYGSKPTGTVTFMDGGTSLGSATVAYGSATLTTSLTTVGANNITAVYSGDANNVTTTSAPVTVQGVAPVLIAQTINFTAVPNQVYGASPVTLSATSSSGLPVTFSYFPTWQCSATGTECYVVPGPCSVTGNTLTIQSDGSCTIIATQGGNGTYAAAGVTQTITIGSTAPNVVMTSPTNGATYIATSDGIASAIAEVPIIGSAAAGTGTSIANISIVLNGNNNLATVVNAASVNTAFNLQPGSYTMQLIATDATGNSGQSPVVNFTVVAGAAQTITFGALSAQTMGASPFTLSATASSGLAVTFASTTPSVCSVSGNTVTLVAAGTCTITASQLGNGSYSAAPQVQQSFAVAVSSSGGGSGGSTSTPTVTLTATNNNIRITSGTTAAVTFNGGGIETGGSIASLSLSQNTGSGPTTVWTGTGANIAKALNLNAGSYVFVLTATDAQGNTASSAPIVVNVTNSSLLGQVNGVEITNAGNPQLFGWVCQGGNASGLSYQVYVNAPSSLGGTLLTSGTANVSGQSDDTTVQTTCGTTGSSHDFTVNLTSYTSQYGGAPIYVQAQDSNGDTIVLPCLDGTCIMPGSLRIGLTSPSPTNTDQYSAPATLFVRSILTQGTAPYPPVSFKITGTLTGGGTFTTQTLSGIVDTAAGAYYATLPNLAAGVYTVTSFVQQGNDILYSMPNIVTVVPGTGSTITLTSPTTGMQTTPVTLSATVAGTAVAGATVQFYENGVAIPGSTVTPSAGIATYNWVSATSGNYLITARLFNGSGTAMAWSTPTEINVSGSSSTTGGAIVPIASTAPIPVSSISPPNTGNPDAGSLPGAISVSNSGAATYSIPITVPPGTAGMTPSLSLNYSSQGGNGMMGVGWSVGGLSSIHRCHKTLAQDGISGGTQGSVSFDQTDRLCLDGQRLVLSTGLDVDAAYWTIGATYSTEIADFSRITMIAGSNGQPAFTVETKSGHIMYYGTNPGGDTTSFITAQGRGDGQALVWALGRVQDLNGNYYSISYSDDASATGTGEYLPQQISYGGNVTAGQAPDLLVDFCYTYGTRPDKTPRFAGGSHNDMVSLLTSVLAFTNTSGSCTSGGQVRELDINYTTSASSGRELVNSVQAKALDPNSTSATYNKLVPLPPTVFNWGQEGQAPQFVQYDASTWPTVAVAAVSTINSIPAGPRPGNVIWADLNGDGLMDAIVPMYTSAAGGVIPVLNPGQATAFNIYLAQPGGSFAAPVLWTIPSNLPTNPLTPTATVDWGFTGDFDGDGSTDFYFMGGVVCLSQLKTVSLTNGQPSTWFSCSNWDTHNVMTYPYTASYLTLNTTGSGRDDIIYANPNVMTTQNPNIGTRCVSVPTTPGSASPYVFQCANYGLGTISLGTSGGTVNVLDPNAENKVGDFNGDGRQDIFRVQYVLDQNQDPDNIIGYQAVVCLSEDDGFHCSNWGGTQPVLLPFEGMVFGGSLAESHSSQIIDLNGDGLSDIWFGNTVCYSTGAAPTPGIPLTANAPGGGFNCQTLAAGPSLSTPVNTTVVTQGLPMTQVGMVDGDGSPKQIVYTANTTTTPYTESWQLCTPYSCQPIANAPTMLTATSSDTACNSIPNTYQTCYKHNPYFNNYLNDGNTGLGVYNSTDYNSGTWAAYELAQTQTSPDMDRIVTVTNGNGQVSQVDYLNGGNASVYSQYTATKGPSNFSYPQRSVTNPGYLVTDHKEADGQGGWLEQQYTYSAQAIDQSGRGSLGFASNTVLQTQTGVLAANQYRQDWPYSGMVLSSTSTETLSSSNPDGSTNSSGVLLSSGSNTLSLTPVVAGNQAIEAWGSSLAPCAICFPNISAATVTHQDLGGQDLGTSNTTTSYDNYGNVTNSTVVSGPTSNQSVVAEFSAQTVSTYDNNNGLCIAAHGNSYLSRICTTSVTKTNGSNAPGGTASITRSSASTYDGNGQLLTQTIEPGLPLQVVTSYIRDTYGNAKSQTQSWTAPAATAIQPNAPTGSMSRMTQTVFDGKGRFPTQYINALNLSSYPTFYPATGAKLSLKDANNLTTNWTADGFGRELTQTTPDQNQTVSYRKQCGTNANSTATTNESNCPANAVVMLATDHLNNGQRTSVPDVSYLDSLGHVLRKQDWGFDGSPIYVDNTYDTLGHLISTTWPYYDGINAPVQASAKHYDLVGRQDEEAHPSWNGLLQTANPCTVPTTIGSNSDACSHTWTQHSGVVHTLTNALDQQRIETYDVLGQLVTAVTQANDNVTPTTTTHFAHDPFGNLVQTVDPANNPINIAYDVMGRKTDLTDPDLGHIHYDVDPVGRTWRQISPIESTATQATAQATIMQYDVLDRMVQRIEPDLASVWVYDVPAGTAATACAATTSCGELVESYTAPLTSPGVLNTSAKTIDTTHTYTNVGLPLQSVKTLDTTTGNVFTTTLGYDGWSRLITTIHQQAVTNTTKQFGQRYNGLGYLNLVEREFGTPTATQAQILWQPTAQDASNRVTQAQLGNGLYDNRCYDAGTGFLGDGTLANATTTCSTSPATLDLQEAYSYDKLGNVVTRTQAWNSGIATGSTSSPVAPTQFTEAFTYDGLNRLTSSTVVGGMQQDFTYDVVGNLTSKTGTSTGNYHYLTNRVTQPHAVAAIDNMGSFSYDADGNQLGGNGRTTTWSSFDMPVSISRSGNSSTFAYGPDHERTSQLESNANIQSKVFYGGAQEVQLDGSGNLVSVKTYWPNGLGVEIDKPNQSTTELDWTHTDRLGSIVAITDVHGNLKEALGFDAWGSRRIANGDTGVTPGTAQVTETTDDKGYTGQEMLDPLELVHLNGRVYDPLIGKFISGDPHITDPMNGQNYNRYSYVLNNPTNDTDPTGFDDVQHVSVSDKPPAVCHGQGCAGVLAQLQKAFDHTARQACAGRGNGCVTATSRAMFNGFISSVQTQANNIQQSAVQTGHDLSDLIESATDSVKETASEASTWVVENGHLVLQGTKGAAKVGFGALATTGGVTSCAGSLGLACVIGVPMALIGSSEMMQGGTMLDDAFHGIRSDGFNPIRITAQDMLGERGGNIAYDSAALATSIGSLAFKGPLVVGPSDGINRVLSMNGVVVTQLQNSKYVPAVSLIIPTQMNQMISVGANAAKAVTIGNDVNKNK